MLYRHSGGRELKPKIVELGSLFIVQNRKMSRFREIGVAANDSLGTINPPSLKFRVV